MPHFALWFNCVGTLILCVAGDVASCGDTTASTASHLYMKAQSSPGWAVTIRALVLFLYGKCPGGFSGGSVVKKRPANADTGDRGSIPALGRYFGGGNGNLLQYSCLENSVDRGAWWDTVHGVAEADMT